MKVISKRIQIKTSKSVEIKNFTPEVIDFIRESDVNNGFLLVHTRHTTTGLILNENENR
ncbi:MAG: YjbQ family protein, partial [Candidatus Helarchaeota archaeon]